MGLDWDETSASLGTFYPGLVCSWALTLVLLADQFSLFLSFAFPHLFSCTWVGSACPGIDFCQDITWLCIRTPTTNKLNLSVSKFQIPRKEHLIGLDQTMVWSLTQVSTPASVSYSQSCYLSGTDLEKPSCRGDGGIPSSRDVHHWCKHHKMSISCQHLCYRQICLCVLL